MSGHTAGQHVRDHNNCMASTCPMSMPFATLNKSIPTGILEVVNNRSPILMPQLRSTIALGKFSGCG